MHNCRMSPDWVARGVAAASVLIAVTSLLWAVLSWRLTGPTLRIHSLAYREVLVLRIFNAGRTAESIEHIVLGGMKGGAGGLDLTESLSLPLRLEPGETKRWQLNPKASPLMERWVTVCAGWSSLWVLTGSMKQRRVEVMPIPEKLPPTVGWRLVPRRTKLARYAPLMAVIPISMATTAGGNSVAAWLIAALGVFVAGRAFWVMGAIRSFRRRRVERWALALGWLLSVIERARASSRPVGTQMPHADIAALTAFLLVAVVLAIPGAAPQTAEAWKQAQDRAKRLGARMRDRVSKRVSET